MLELKLKNLKYQEAAIQSVVKVFDGTDKDTFDNACFKGIRSNICKLTSEQITDNIKGVSLLQNRGNKRHKPKG